MDQSGGLGIGAHPHVPVDPHSLRLGLLVVLVVGRFAVLVLGVVPTLLQHHGGAGDLRPVLFGDRLALAVPQVAHARLVQVGCFLRVEHWQAFGTQPLDFLGQGVGVVGVVPQPLGLVLEGPAEL